MSGTDMPDAITNPKTPRDQDNQPIKHDTWYLVRQGRGKPVRVLVREDPDDGELVCQPKSGGLWQRVNEMDPEVIWERVEEDEL